MKRHELDDVMYKLSNIYELKSKKLLPGARQEWEDSLCVKERDDCIWALNRHKETEQFLPQISQILALVNERRKSRGEETELVYKGNDPETRQALINDANPPKYLPKSEAINRLNDLIAELSGPSRGKIFSSGVPANSNQRKIRKSERDNY